MATSPSPAHSAGSEDLLAVRTEQHDGVVVVQLHGEVDLVTVPAVTSALDTALSGRPDALIVDLSLVGFLCSKGVSVLIDVQERAEQQGNKLYLVTAQRAVLRPLQLLGLQERFRIRDTVQAALKELTAD